MTITADDLAVAAVQPDMRKKIEAESGSDLARLLDGDVVARLTKEAQRRVSRCRARVGCSSS